MANAASRYLFLINKLMAIGMSDRLNFFFSDSIKIFSIIFTFENKLKVKFYFLADYSKLYSFLSGLQRQNCLERVIPYRK